MLTEDIIENKKRVKRLKEVTEMLEILQYEMQIDDDPPDSTYISKIDKAIKVLRETQSFLEYVYTDNIVGKLK